ncbi:MAG: hypothetical protein U9P14_00630 [Gemmatimonadota bacterium]|nr:hypothetical protein [Gemmatimonadota bacterium]
MKMVFLSYDIGIDDSVMLILKEAGIKSYTKWQEVQDVPEKGRPRMGTHIWPGVNSAMLIPVPEDKEDLLMETISSFNEQTKFEGIKTYCWNLEDICVK